MEEIEEKVLRRIREGIPLEKRPFKSIAEDLELDEEEVIERISAMVEKGWIRRIGCVPHHYNLGITANGMSAWDVPDKRVERVGNKFGSFDFVSHCYRRPRRRPIWPYNLFAMVHGRSRDEVYEKVEKLEAAIDTSDVESEVLFSTKLLKKQGSKVTE